MSGSHGDFFSEIGKLVLEANQGQIIDLTAKAEELALRYDNLGLSEEIIARAITRSIGAIGVSMAVVSQNSRAASGELIRLKSGQHAAAEPPVDKAAAKIKALFPSGVRLALLS